MKDYKDPVLKRDASFSIIVLRNDRNVVRFRLNSFLIKSFILFFALFSIASGTAGYAAHYYWKKYTGLRRERSELAAKLGENRRQLGRFAGIEIIQETQPRSAMSGVAVNGKNGKTPEGGAPASARTNGTTAAAVAAAVPAGPPPTTTTSASDRMGTGLCGSINVDGIAFPPCITL